MRQHYFDPPALDNWLYLLARLWAAEFNIRDRPGKDHIQHWNAFDELEDSSEFNITDPRGRHHIQHWSVAAEHVRGNPAAESQFYNAPATGGFEEHVGGALRSMCGREGGASEHAQQTVM